MAIRTPQVTVAATPTLIADGSTGTPSDPVTVQFYVPAGGVTVFWGGDDVTAATGMPVTAGSSSPVFDLLGDKLYGIVTTGTQVINTGKTRS